MISRKKSPRKPIGSGRVRRVDRWLTDWADSVIEDSYKSNFSGINVIERILRDPGVSTDKGSSKVLWWPRNRRVARVSKAAHQLTPTEIVILVVHYGHVLNEDKSKFTKKDLAEQSSIGLRRYGEIQRNARNKISRILNTYDKIGVIA
jgi:hypothetical protein